MRPLRQLAIALWLLLPGACSNAAPGDSDPGPLVPVVVTRRLSFEPSQGLRLAPGEPTTLRVGLTDRASRPVVGEQVDFALLGEPGDASLVATRATTDHQGRAAVVFRAPTRAATLRVRARAPRSVDAYRDVSVSGQGFGALVLGARYGGVRAPTGFALSLYDNGTCSSATAGDPVRTARLASLTDLWTFGDLPVGSRPSARAAALGIDDEVLAASCVDGLLIARDTETQAQLLLRDLPLVPRGEYVLELALDLGALPGRLAAQWGRAVEAHLGSGSQAAAGAILEGVADAVEARAGADARASFEDMVVRTLRAEVQADLTRRSAEPLSALLHLAAQAAAVTRSVDATAALTATARSDDSLVHIDSVRLRLDPLSPDLSADDVAFEAPSNASGTMLASSDDRAICQLIGLALPVSQLTGHALAALLARGDRATTADYLRGLADCGAVAQIVGARAPSCDGTCVRQACDLAVTRIAAVFDAAVAVGGATHTTISVRFEASARGFAASRRVQSLEAASAAGHFDDDLGLTVTGVALLNAR